MNRLLLLLFYLIGSFWGTSLFANSIEGLSLLGERNSPTKPPKTLTPEITCSITGGGGLSRQVVCFGDSLGLGTVTDGEDGTARWYGQTTGGQWTALDSALVTKRKWAGA
ncbi:MAG TPA: hypothetical protein PKY12_02355, partial [Catalimonadaceae bacterium]|nr:hypothetical protein [Catalimonadaceae bacterium]